MITTINYKAVMKKCDELTKDGKKLSVSWDGGNDEGYFTLKLDDSEIESDYGEGDSIIDMMEEELDYGSFAGNFSTQGEVVYDRVTKCFEGSDGYSEDSYAIHECSIKIQIPCEVWFDKLQINLDVDIIEVNSCEIKLVVLNGPITDTHLAVEKEIKKDFCKSIAKEIQSIENFTGVVEQFTIDSKEFSAKGNKLTYYLKEFNYNLDEYTDKEVLISLINKIDDND